MKLTRANLWWPNSYQVDLDRIRTELLSSWASFSHTIPFHSSEVDKSQPLVTKHYQVHFDRIRTELLSSWSSFSWYESFSFQWSWWECEHGWPVERLPAHGLLQPAGVDRQRPTGIPAGRARRPNTARRAATRQEALPLTRTPLSVVKCDVITPLCRLDRVMKCDVTHTALSTRWSGEVWRHHFANFIHTMYTAAARLCAKF